MDLFSGCGGFGLGAELAGFRTAVAVDIDADLQSAYRLNFPYSRVVQADVAELDSTDWAVLLGGEAPDGIIGGPPCQGFSRMGRRASTDERNTLVNAFYQQVLALQPRFFVMENVEGILDGENAVTLSSSIELVKPDYYILGPLVINAADFGAATRRKRVVVIGFKKSNMPIPTLRLVGSVRSRSFVRDAIADLPAPLGEDTASNEFGWATLEEQDGTSRYAERARKPPPKGLGWPVALDRHSKGQVSGFFGTTHARNVERRFSELAPGEIDHTSKYPRLDWDGVCPTLRAGTGKERGSFQAARPIHPEKPRVITVREAARLQGFPDWFVFHPTKWHSFRMIGNSVSPYVAETILRRIKKLMQHDATEVAA